jgi:hypothetical protein
MKVVINKCYGGFGLSEEAKLKLAVSDCPHMQLFEPKAYYGGGKGWEKEFARDSNSDGPFKVLVIDGKIVTDEHGNDHSRSCPFLLEVVEAGGADGRHAKLKIVEIPDGVEYEIDEYDGMEHIAEVHRTWG